MNDNPDPAGTEPALASESSPSNEAPPLMTEGASSAGKGSGRQVVLLLLTAFLALFVAEAIVSLVDDSMVLMFGVHGIGLVRGTLAVLVILLSIAVYGLMALTPMIPKLLFLPLALFPLAGVLLPIPFMIYFHHRLPLIYWCVSLVEVIVGLLILWRCQGSLRIHRPLVRPELLASRGFSWSNLLLFLLANVFVLLPAVLVYLWTCASLAIGHFSEGFLALRPGGLIVQARKYVRDDGKVIQLLPMSHIGETEFYRSLSQSFPTNAVILMEGVTDQKNLLTNRITYHRVAQSLGVAEQQKEFKPHGEIVRADVDIEAFSTNTIGYLNLAMLIHAKGLNLQTLKTLMTPMPAHFEEQLFDDLLNKRNQRLLKEVQERLPETELMIVPWGAAHMPGIARGLEKEGFRADESREYVAIRLPFWKSPNR